MTAFFVLKCHGCPFMLDGYYLGLPQYLEFGLEDLWKIWISGGTLVLKRELEFRKVGIFEKNSWLA